MIIQNIFKKTFLPLLTLLFLSVGVVAQDTTDVRTIKMVGTDQMLFDITEIEAQPGETIKIELTTVSRIPKEAMAHNVVILQQDTDVQAYVNASAKAKENLYLAPEMEDEVIAATDLAGGEETVEITFTVPEETGEYEYICSFPGHYAAGMRGVLIVKE